MSANATLYEYAVYVDDNFHYMDEEHRYRLGVFPTLERAVGVCKRIVDDFLADQYKPGQSAEELWALYRSFGEDPWIRTADPEVSRVAFSAWSYARERCEAFCRQGT